MNYDTGHLQHCRELIEQKLGWPPAGEWRDFEFTELSEKIFDDTGVQLSTTTLKRVFGKIRYESLPSSITLNTLARYLGFENWMSFKSAGEDSSRKQPVFTAEPARKPPSKSIPKKTLAGIFAVLTLVLVFGFVLFSGPSSSSATVKDVLFTSKKLAEGLPNSVVFRVDLKGMKTDDIVIQQSWDSTRTVRLKPGQTEATALYYLPGYFRAKLIVNKKIIKEHDLYIRSNGWMATLDDDTDPPEYLKKDELILNRGMEPGPAILDKIKNSDRPLTLMYHLVQPFAGLHSDQFVLETALQNTFGDGPAVCKTARVFILCSKGAFIIPFTIPGCASTVNLKLGNRTWEGRSNDLSVFGIDPSQKLDLRVEALHRQVKIYVNGRLLREATYDTDAGDIVGIRYSFLGAGRVDYIKVSNAPGQPVYENHFR